MELSVSSETTFFNMKLQLEICPQQRTGSSAEDTGRIDTSMNYNSTIMTPIHPSSAGGPVHPLTSDCNYCPEMTRFLFEKLSQVVVFCRWKRQ